MTASRLAAAVVAAALGLGAVASAEAQGSIDRLSQMIVDQSKGVSARINWEKNYIVVEAAGSADRTTALSDQVAEQLAFDAARADGYAKLAEIIAGVAIDGTTLVRNAMVEDQTVRQTVRAHVRGAVVLDRKVSRLRTGDPWVELVMGLPINGPAGVTGSLAGYAAKRPVDAFSGDRGVPTGERYTGLIVDASDTAFSPALMPRVLEEGSGKVVFGPHLVQAAAISQQGVVGYAPALGEAKGNARVGANPLIVRAVDARGGNKGDLALSTRDAERVRAADKDGRFIENGAVVIVAGKGQREIAAQPGKRHAVVVGVEDYPQGAPGAPPALSFAAQDARSLAAALGNASGGGTVTLLTNEQATREGVVAALRALRAVVRDEDSVVVFFSGHGSVGVGPEGRAHYFLVPRDGRLNDLAGTALMDLTLEDEIGQLPARQVVVILDTCYSGGGGNVIRARGVTNPAAAGHAVVARSLIEASSGRVVISAARPDQVAFEDPQRGAGVFTSFVLEGLAGPADLDNDGVITALEIFQFVSPKVRAHSRQQFQVEQTPVLEVRGLSGEISLVKRR